MTRTITAMFDSRAEAETAREQLARCEGVQNVQILDQSSAGAMSSGEYSSSQNRGFWAELKSAFVPDEDRHTYEEGARRGGAVLTASVDDTGADQACRILDEANCVDIDQRSSEWRESGWDYQPGSSASGLSGNTQRGEVAEEHIPISEEELRIGKREVERGGVRVRSYVVEEPVHEQVSLRDEHVSVELRAVDEPVAATGDAFQERTIEMTETAEEAVVAKEARVREELVVRKDVEQKVEDVNENLRHTEVEIDDETDRAPANDTFQRDYQQAASESEDERFDRDRSPN
jgi:uncharacterized protein (TIGR02271 family)